MTLADQPILSSVFPHHQWIAITNVKRHIILRLRYRTSFILLPGTLFGSLLPYCYHLSTSLPSSRTCSPDIGKTQHRVIVPQATQNTTTAKLPSPLKRPPQKRRHLPLLIRRPLHLGSEEGARKIQQGVGFDALRRAHTVISSK